MRLEDRVAFACMFLSDGKLHEYVRHTADALVQRGDLSGVLLTGEGRAAHPGDVLGTRVLHCAVLWSRGRRGGRGAAAALAGRERRRAECRPAGRALLHAGAAGPAARAALARQVPRPAPHRPTSTIIVS